MQRNAGHGAKYYETVELILVASLMFPYVLDRKHSINDYLLATEHNKTLFTQILFTELKMSHCSVSWALVSEYYRYYQHKIIKNGASPKCRLCHEFDESIEHIISGCPVLARKEYLERHDKALTYIHWHICKHYEIEVIDKWYDHKPNTVTEGKDVTILWDMPIHTDKEIKANRPDIIVKGKSKKQCILIDMAVPSERNIAAKEVEKL